MRSRAWWWLENVLLILGDAMSIYLAWRFAYYLRFGNPLLQSFVRYPEMVQPWELYQKVLALAVPMWLVLLHAFPEFTSFRIPQSYFKISVEIGKAICTGALAMLAASFLSRHYEYSRMVLLLSTLGSIMLLTWYRFLLGFMVKTLNPGRPGRVAVIGNGKVPELLQRLLTRQPGISVVGYNFPIQPEELARQVENGGITEVIFSTHPHGVANMAPLIEDCQRRGLECKVVPDLLELRMGEMLLDRSLGIPLFHLKSPSLGGPDYIFKRLFDIALSGILLIGLAVPMAVLALLIKLESKGPVFYLQKRMGYRGRWFLIWKFRTMVQGAENMLTELLVNNERPGGVAFKMVRDPRVTRLGKCMRRWSLDELPQLFNVLKGEMSLVGPRPQVEREALTYDAAAWRRLSLLPGITGLWQIRGRAALSQQDMLVLDTYYLENWSLALDMEILFKTLPAILSGRGAY